MIQNITPMQAGDSRHAHQCASCRALSTQAPLQRYYELTIGVLRMPLCETCVYALHGATSEAVETIERSQWWLSAPSHLGDNEWLIIANYMKQAITFRTHQRNAHGLEVVVTRTDRHGPMASWVEVGRDGVLGNGVLPADMMAELFRIRESLYS
jgi:hypothetical protein